LAGPLLLLAHGAGAGSRHPFMVRIARELDSRGVRVVTFDFPYMKAGRKVPDKGPMLEAAWREQIDLVRSDSTLSSLALFIGGKSMGGRIASQVAAQGVAGLFGLVFLGYPLHPPGKPQQRRDAHLPSIKEPMLFVQGERDEFGTAQEIRDLLPTLTSAQLHVVAGGDHSLRPRSRGAGSVSQEEVFRTACDAIAAWVKSVAAT
jgi:predicted alpha/beta-hydrolase family hydrolase